MHETANRSALLTDTFGQIIREQLPNLFRLYLNPHVTQTCFCLERYIQTTWPAHTTRHASFQTFIANGFDEALSGAIKLARYCASIAGRPTTGLILDGDDRLAPFAAATAIGGKVEFLPGLVILRRNEQLGSAAVSDQSFDFVVLVAGESGMDPIDETVLRWIRKNAALVIMCVNRGTLAALRCEASDHTLPPDIVVFDESFVNHDVPFGAFTARKTLYDVWNRSDKSTFHSTTFQPNTIASLHFMRCLEQDDPEFHLSLMHDLRLIEHDIELRKKLFRSLYSPSLARAISMTGFDTPNIRATGDFVYADGRKVFDGVSGVACSIRGHNPNTYAEEMLALADVPDGEAEVASRLRKLTGLEHLLPAVSGASAVENALKVALVAQSPRRHVLALKSGFGGKTLFALTGTWNAAYKEHIEPLYGDVAYVDPFAVDAIAQIDAVLAKVPVAVVQKVVRDVRVHGLLIGIELDATRWPQRWFRKRLFWFYLFSMLCHPRFPVLVGFCQYEPNVLKITPPLTTDTGEIRQMCATITEVLKRPFYQLLATVLAGVVRSMGFWRSKHERIVSPPHAALDR
jgi:acetylornithine/succinyldiaminopimelate/putrescine aminotransferase